MSFSVIIPTHNREALVVRAIDSALAADSGERLEVIVVDDASVDRTRDVLSERYSNEPRVRLVRVDVNEGPSGARNRGLAVASGEYVLFLDSDDVLMPDALRLAYAAFEAETALQFVTLEGEAFSIDQPDVEHRIVVTTNPGWSRPGFVADQFEAIEIRGCSDGRTHTLKVGDCSQAILFGDLFYLSGLAVRRSAARAAGPFNLRFRYLEDWEFSARLCLLGIGGYFDVLGFRRQMSHADQLSRLGTPWRRATMHHHVLQGVRSCGVLREPLPTLARAQAAADYWLGRCMHERHHPRAARGFFIRSLMRLHKPLKNLVRLAQGVIVSRRRAASANH